MPRPVPARITLRQSSSTARRTGNRSHSPVLQSHPCSRRHEHARTRDSGSVKRPLDRRFTNRLPSPASTHGRASRRLLANRHCRQHVGVRVALRGVRSRAPGPVALAIPAGRACVENVAPAGGRPDRACRHMRSRQFPVTCRRPDPECWCLSHVPIMTIAALLRPPVGILAGRDLHFSASGHVPMIANEFRSNRGSAGGTPARSLRAGPLPTPPAVCCSGSLTGEVGRPDRLLVTRMTGCSPCSCWCTVHQSVR